MLLNLNTLHIQEHNYERLHPRHYCSTTHVHRFFTLTFYLGAIMTTAIKPMVLHSQSKAESIAHECMRDDHGWRYVAIQWGPIYWVVAISDEDGLIGYL